MQLGKKRREDCLGSFFTKVTLTLNHSRPDAQVSVLLHVQNQYNAHIPPDQ